MTEEQKQAIETIKKVDKELSLVAHMASALSWDQETFMPEAAIEERSEQVSLLQTYYHRLLVSEELGRALEDIGADEKLVEDFDLSRAAGKLPEDLSPVDKARIRHLFRQQHRAVKLPETLVAELARSGTLSQAAWAKARQAKDFAAFKPHLEKMLDLKRQEAQEVGYKDHPYDALLDSYEPGMKTAEVSRVFSELREGLVPLVQKIAASAAVDDSILKRRYPRAGQEAFSFEALEAVGYDLKRGRLDPSVHPFTITLGRDDVRITTRYDEDFFNSAFFSTLHEAGHGLYELGFGPDIRDSLMAGGTSLAIHESQSRTWENMVGRSRSFWLQFFPRLKKHFPGLLDDVDVEKFYRAINKVEPSHIRVEADEVTYSLHIMLRFFIETRLIQGEISVSELPELWREQSRELLGIVPETDAEGLLQDVHWSFGAIGYFPTYSLGNIVGAQFFEAMRSSLGNIDDLMQRGDFTPILNWLRENIHQYGSMKTAGELLRDITGAGLDAKPFLTYLEKKYSEIYQF